MSRAPVCRTDGCGCACHRRVVRRAPVTWTVGMDRLLLAGLDRGDTVEQIAALVFMAPGAVRWRCRQLGQSLRDGWYSPTEIAGLLGVSWRSVRRWVDEGWLMTEPHGRRWRRVRVDALDTFVATYGGVLFPASGVTDPHCRRLAEVAAAMHARRTG